MEKLDELLSRGVANIIPGKEQLLKKLESGEKLSIYLGIDPTSTHIHLGHAVPLRKLQAFAELGHNITFLIGDFTALIGDTSDKESERPQLTAEQIQENFKTYKAQAEKILDFSKVTVRYNSEWLSKLTFTDIVKLTQHFSVGDFISRELIKKRLQSEKRVGLHEVLYPVMQGYDSYYLDTDLQLGGTDQTFNMQAGRTLQKDLRNKESFVMTNEFLLGTDGRKMSKTWGNAIWLTDTPEDMYGKVMSIKDELITQYFLLATNTTLQDIQAIEQALKDGENPIQIKKQLAYRIVSELHSAEEAQNAQEYFEKTVQKREIPDDIPEVKITEKQIPLTDLLLTTTLAPSKTEAKRLIEQGAVEINQEKVTDVSKTVSIQSGMLIKAGKRKYVRIVL